MAAQAAQSRQDQGQPAPVIIKRVKKGGETPHHGGAWKVAYADFVTAMMAFFLLLWLLNATTEEQKQAISNYFAPESVAYTKSGSGGVLGGQTITEDGAMSRPTAPQGLVVPVVTAPAEQEPEGEPALRPGEDAAESEGDAGGGDGIQDDHWMPPREAGGGANLGHAEEPDIAAEEPGGDRTEISVEAARRAEEAVFEETAQALREAFESEGRLAEFAGNIVVKETAMGLQIEVVDQEKISMFPRGSAAMYDHTRDIVGQIAGVLAEVPDHRIAITGHTDAAKYADPTGYSNWELSTDRANASRRALIDFGIDPQRVVQVVGKADRELLIPSNPEDARNRRIAIVLIRNVPKTTSEEG